jgi:hypothetical protein
MYGRGLALLSALLMLQTGAWSLATAQDTLTADHTRKSRVLAEAVSSYRHAGEFYLVGARVSPFTVVGAFASPDSARRAARLAGRLYEVSGPYRGSGTRTPWEVLSVTVRIRDAAGREQTLQYDPRTVDAVFLTMQAVDKFMMPYYTNLYGRPYADSVRRAVVEETPPKPPCHRYSFPCEPPDNPLIRPIPVIPPGPIVPPGPVGRDTVSPPPN